MPELPDVAEFKRYFDSTALHKRIRGAEVLDRRMLDGITPAALDRFLRENIFTGTRRHGKNLFAFSRRGGRVLRLHFGMTGWLQYFRKPADQPRCTRVRIDFANGRSLAIVDQRILGSVGIIDDPDAFIAERRLGPDALDGELEPFRQRIRRRRRDVKSVLMDQSVIAGLGNIWSDEVLFQARMHPARPVDTISEKELRKLFDTIRQVMRAAVDHHADFDSMPGFFLHHRSEGARCPRCGREIKPINLAGRRGWYCQKCQK